MRLLTELTEDVTVTLQEDKETGKKRHFIEGVFLQSELKNKNGRVYPKSVMENEVNRYIAEKVNTNRAVGELGHPQGPQINLDRVSHRIVSLVKEGNNYVGKARIIDQPGTPGATVIGLLEAGVQLGVSSRGLGSLRNRNGIMEVCDDFRLATAGDIVADPSAPDAFVAGLMEGVEWICMNGVWTPQSLKEATQAINHASRNPNKAVFEQTAIRLFEDFMSGMKSR